MINRQQLLQDLQRLLPTIEQDILAYSESVPAVAERLQAEYKQAREAKRTAAHFVAWRADEVTQAAAAWVLTCVFVRFLEDNALLDAPVLAGPVETGEGRNALQEAKERMVAYFNEHPTDEEREYLLNLFGELERQPVIAELLDHRHNPLWRLPVSADGAKALIDFFQKIDPDSGQIVHDFTDPDWDTRFLGDLYQDLSESVRKRYALLQTPEFVESFILDHTLEKAIDTFGLEGLRLIDPTCGSGHFLLTTFERIFNDWVRREPGVNTRALAQRALDAVYGVDINPYAVAISRFRLLIAAMKASGSRKIRESPDFHFNLACGDSLLLGRRFEWEGQGIQQDHLDDSLAHVYETEDMEKLDKILGQQYHVVVGNPPYITVKDKALNQAYRSRYTTCYRQYSLGVPFTERFFDLTLPAKDNRPAGYLGMITTNSFMKREFGKHLIEKYLPNKRLTHVIDTSGAYIPGHGTPTVILFARNQMPKSEPVRAVLGIRGEPSTPDDAAQGQVWRSIVELLDKPGSENEFVSVVDQEPEIYRKHPWSVGGGGAAGLIRVVERGSNTRLGQHCLAIGFVCITKQDDVFVQDHAVLHRFDIKESERRSFGIGEEVRNWSHSSTLEVLFPYRDDLTTRTECEFLSSLQFMWPFREDLYSRKVFGGQTYREAGKPWYEFGQIPVERFKIPLSITFPFVATHNHFVLDRGGKVFKQTAPVIKLPNGTSEADHLVLLGLLNSSLACFWGRQVFFPKGGYADGKWEERLEWDGTKLKRFPIPQPSVPAACDDDSRLLPGYPRIESLARQIDALAQQLGALMPLRLLEQADESFDLSLLDASRKQAEELRARMVAWQEELDWLCYQAYGLLEEAVVYDGELPPVKAGERAFEIQMARELADGEGSDAWFTRHKLVRTTEIPTRWPEDYRALVERRLSLMQSERFIKLIEKPEYKRRWLPLEWDKQEQEALRNWLLDYLEAQSFSSAQPALITCAQLADSLHRSQLAQRIAQRYLGDAAFDAQKLVVSLVADDHVPQMAAARLKPAAMKKFRAWQETWDKQRAEDAIDARTELAEDDPQYLSEAEATRLKQQEVGDIPLPPKYAASDFRKPGYWKLRGKLDVPKERFFSLPGCEKDGDATLVIGWAGMNHLQRAQAIAAWYLERKENEGWTADRLKPMLVALDELIPWLKQWHNEIDPDYGVRMGDYYEGFLLEELRLLEISRDELQQWGPPAVVRKKRARKKKA